MKNKYCRPRLIINVLRLKEDKNTDGIIHEFKNEFKLDFIHLEGAFYKAQAKGDFGIHYHSSDFSEHLEGAIEDYVLNGNSLNYFVQDLLITTGNGDMTYITAFELIEFWDEIVDNPGCMASTKCT